ncbi:hypothetical protein KY285_031160 [Solanum tuberosum]|nr:hypothetical protein KY285_031160 [Solanum tuberosum]
MDQRKGNTAVNNVTGGECSYPKARSVEESTNELGGRGVSFNEEQYKQLLGLLNKDASTNNAQQTQGCYDGNMTGATHHVTADIKRLEENFMNVRKPGDKDLSSGRVKGTGRMRDGLYILNDTVRSRSHTDHRSIHAVATSKNKDEVDLWHRRH